VAGLSVRVAVTGTPSAGLVLTLPIWRLSGTGEDRRRRALRLIGGAFTVLAF
jgi:hypothetical protein